MGCAVAKGKGAKKATTLEETVSDPGQAPGSPQHWATAAKDSPSLSTASTSPSKTAEQQPLVIKDADDDDEIEVIYEAAPKKVITREHQDLLAANAQEAPDGISADQEAAARQKAEEDERRRKEDERKKAELSKTQQEEAKKLAERRKNFDASRYQREQQAPTGSSDESSGFVQTAPKIAREDTPQVTSLSDRPGMVLGLNQGHAAKNGYSQQPQSCLGLPGGIFEEFEPIQEQVPKKKIHTHDDVESRGFDDDDEKMMAEILEDFDM